MNTTLVNYCKALILFGLAPLVINCNEDDATTLKSPVQAVATIFEDSDENVTANLYLISTSDPNNHVFVNDATNVRIRLIPGGNEVSLASKGNGRYSSNSGLDDNLIYEPSATYQYKFDLDGDSAGAVKGGNFIAVVDAPSNELVTFTYTNPPEADGDSSSFTYTPTNLKGIVIVRDSEGDIVYQTFDFTNPTFSGDKWATLFSNGTGSLSVDVYDAAELYTIEFCAVAHSVGFSDSLSAELGVASGFLVGKCTKPLDVDLRLD